jgi:thiol-disulfide isomerase/thioredoxin
MAVYACLFLATISLAGVRNDDIQVTTLQGERVALRTLIGEGQPVVMEFWATWCVPCRKTMPHLNELSRKYARDGLVVIGLTVEDPARDAEKVRQFIASARVTYPIAFASRDFYQQMNQKREIGVPKILIFDRSGRLVEHIKSYSPFTNRRVSAAVATAVRR